MNRRVIHVIDSVTATTTSDLVNILGAKKVVLLCQRSDHNSGSSAFTAKVGTGTALADYKKWITNANNTNAQTLIRATTLTLSADGVDFLTMSPEDTFDHIEVKVTETDDGTHDAWLILDY